jgi:hypothetical protein
MVSLSNQEVTENTEKLSTQITLLMLGGLRAITELKIVGCPCLFSCPLEVDPSVFLFLKSLLYKGISAFLSRFPKSERE